MGAVNTMLALFSPSYLCCHGAGVMFTCDAFGAHYCTVDAFDTELEALAPHYRFYYDCLMCAGHPKGLVCNRNIPKCKICRYF